MAKAKKTDARDKPLSQELLQKMDAYWCAVNYLSVGQIYLYDNPLLKKPLKLEHVKSRLLGHFGTTPGLNFYLCSQGQACYLRLPWLSTVDPSFNISKIQPGAVSRAWV